MTSSTGACLMDIGSSFGDNKTYQGFGILTHQPKFYEMASSKCHSPTLKATLPDSFKAYGNDTVSVGITISTNWWMIVAIIELSVILFLLFARK